MIVILTGETGSGKTDTSWALVSILTETVFLDCDWFASRSPFSWECAADVESVYRAILSQIAFHIGEGRKNFVITLTHQMALVFKAQIREFERFGLPIHAFRLAPQPHIVQRRIVERARDQTCAEVINATRQREALDNAFRDGSIFMEIDNTDFDAQITAKMIICRSEC